MIDLLTGLRARKAGIVYLQDSLYTLQTKPRSRSWNFTGCIDLRNYLLRPQPRIHVFSHFHEWRGAYVHAWESDGNELLEVKVIDNDEDDDVEDLNIRVEGEDEVFAGDDEVLQDDHVGHNDNGTQLSPETVFVNVATSPAGKRT
ncbi:hypothetical protein C0995_002461 [Termitomyces sp. Mi166|nr:hypothetical protein C0995_002461 [Termitomyces sp. Mi166\